MNRDIVAIGCSAGGIEVLLGMAAELPADLRASLFVVVHMRPDRESELPDLLTRRGRLPARHPLHDENIEHGAIYVAPPDMHMQLRAGAIEVVRGPRDNGHRPAADVLFRTASAAYGARVIGVVLSGYQDCGTAGMMSIKARGGLSVVQDPESASVPDMPRNVLAKVKVDHVVHPLELPGLLTRLVASSARAA
jgi:two-component system, chemotaxis family, protein-glutamate methylesterase/glutaminase